MPKNLHTHRNDHQDIEKDESREESNHLYYSPNQHSTMIYRMNVIPRSFHTHTTHQWQVGEGGTRDGANSFQVSRPKLNGNLAWKVAMVVVEKEEEEEDDS